MKQGIGRAFLIFAITCSPALADSQFVQKAMGEYNAGNYSDAASDFGAALSTDFNNPKVHYFLGSTYVHMNQKDAAIREYRISFALDPDNEVGKLSRQALTLLGAEPDGVKALAPAKPGDLSKPLDPTKPADPLAQTKGVDPSKPADPTKPSNTAVSIPDNASPLQRSAASQLQQQAENLKNVRTEESHQQSSSLSKTGSSVVQRAKNEIDESNKYMSRRGYTYQAPMSPEAQRQLDSLKSMYQSKQNGYTSAAQEHGQKVQESVDNLMNLINEAPKSGSVHVNPAGTNLYIRNYSMTPSTKTSTPAPPAVPAVKSH